MTRNIEITATPDCSALARLHAAAFEKGWSAQSIQDMLAIIGTVAFVEKSGFGLLRAIDNAEILTLAVDPAAHRKGVGLALTKAMIDWAKQKQVKSLFLEVRESNLPASKLYEKAGFTEFSRRKAYYDGREDAVVLQKNL